jgi:hypothetical protein
MRYKKGNRCDWGSSFGADRARGKFLAFTDDDCRPDANWLSKLETAFQRTPSYMVGGRTPATPRY